MVPESNDLMRTSYYLVDENMCFLDCSGGGKTASPSILAVGVEEALNFAGFDKDKFEKRGGYYEWSKEPLTECQKNDDSLNW